MKLFLKTVFLFATMAHASGLLAQTSAIDTINNNLAINNAINAYHQYLFPETNLYNGSEYVNYAYTINEGIPFFETAAFSTGHVLYDSILYQNVPLLYDEVKEIVVIQDPSGRNSIQLNNEKLTSFGLLDHHFVKLQQDSLGRSPIRTGFYDALYQGKVSVYEKQIKKVLESVTMTEGVRRHIDEQDVFFVQKGSTFYTVKNKREVLNILKDRKKEVQQFIKKNKLNVRRATETSLIKIASYYDQLTNK